MPSKSLIDLSQIDFDNPIYTLEDIHSENPQRFEFSQLTAVVHVDEEQQLVVGYKDITSVEFWVAGHMPGYPLMPGVIQCECAAQLAGFYARRFDVVDGDYVGFGGIKDVRFRKPIQPGCRLDLICQITRVRARKMAYFAFQGFVGDDMVFEGTMIGVGIASDGDS